MLKLCRCACNYSTAGWQVGAVLKAEVPRCELLQSTQSKLELVQKQQDAGADVQSKTAGQGAQEWQQGGDEVGQIKAGRVSAEEAAPQEHAEQSPEDALGWDDLAPCAISEASSSARASLSGSGDAANVQPALVGSRCGTATAANQRDSFAAGHLAELDARLAQASAIWSATSEHNPLLPVSAGV